MSGTLVATLCAVMCGAANKQMPAVASSGPFRVRTGMWYSDPAALLDSALDGGEDYQSRRRQGALAIVAERTPCS